MILMFHAHIRYELFSLECMCTYGVCVYMLMLICVQGLYTWRPDINVECLRQSFCTLFFETESL